MMASKKGQQVGHPYCLSTGETHETDSAMQEMVQVGQYILLPCRFRCSVYS